MLLRFEVQLQVQINMIKHTFLTGDVQYKTNKQCKTGTNDNML